MNVAVVGRVDVQQIAEREAVLAPRIESRAMQKRQSAADRAEHVERGGRKRSCIARLGRGIGVVALREAPAHGNSDARRCFGQAAELAYCAGRGQAAREPREQAVAHLDYGRMTRGQ